MFLDDGQVVEVGSGAQLKRSSGVERDERGNINCINISVNESELDRPAVFQCSRVRIRLILDEDNELWVPPNAPQAGQALEVVLPECTRANSLESGKWVVLAE